ncbi:annexin D3-like [Zingiber officinale]|uniref:annexin D3-like n=1 Tax=Zingiber officinale TaxID=94328 RepID=UPI001C4CE01B|nr:annexin D3-like [Zingiber officinale]
MTTITVPPSPLSPDEDANKLRKAFQGLGTDEKTVIEILSHRSAGQRLAIAKAYAHLYGESLLERLHSELSGDFRKAVMLWTMDPAERDAKLANKALKRKGDRDLWVIIEVACASSPDHLVAVRKAYCSLYSSSMEEEVAQSFSTVHPLSKLLVRLLTSYRYSGDHVDSELAKYEAAQLSDAVKSNQIGRDDVIRILSSRNKSQLKETFKYYNENYGKHIVEDIEVIDKSQFTTLLKTAIWCLASPENHFAEVVRTSVVGLGTDEDSLTRAIVTRAEIDLEKIKEEYKIRYKTTLRADVIGDTSGDYKRFLLALVGSEGP